MPNRPSSGEYSEYAARYVNLVPDGDIGEILLRSMNDTAGLFAGLTEEQAAYRYAPGKWSLKQVLGHLTDNERIMSCRLLRIARGDGTPLPGYDQDMLMNGASFDSRTLAELLEDYMIARQSTLSLMRGVSEEAWTRKGVVSGNEFSALAWAYIIAGHELHHIRVIKANYLT